MKIYQCKWYIQNKVKKDHLQAYFLKEGKEMFPQTQQESGSQKSLQTEWGR